MEQSCFGMTKEEVKYQFSVAVEEQWYNEAQPMDERRKMVLMSMLSDVQELVELGAKEDARQRINIVKVLMMEELGKETQA